MEDAFICFVLGGPGSGKGTQCAKIAERYGWAHLSVGDLLRAEVEEGSELGQEAEAMMSAGQMVPTELVLDLLLNAMLNTGGDKFLVDGFPRKLDQLEAFADKVKPCDAVLVFTVPDDIAVERLLKRGETSGRADDNEETIKARLEAFWRESSPVIDVLKQTGRVLEVDATGDEEQIWESVTQFVEKIENQPSSEWTKPLAVATDTPVTAELPAQEGVVAQDRDALPDEPPREPNSEEEGAPPQDAADGEEEGMAEAEGDADNAPAAEGEQEQGQEEGEEEVAPPADPGPAGEEGGDENGDEGEPAADPAAAADAEEAQDAAQDEPQAEDDAPAPDDPTEAAAEEGAEQEDGAVAADAQDDEVAQEGQEDLAGEEGAPAPDAQEGEEQPADDAEAGPAAEEEEEKEEEEAEAAADEPPTTGAAEEEDPAAAAEEAPAAAADEEAAGDEAGAATSAAGGEDMDAAEGEAGQEPPGAAQDQEEAAAEEGPDDPEDPEAAAAAAAEDAEAAATIHAMASQVFDKVIAEASQAEALGAAADGQGEEGEEGDEEEPTSPTGATAATAAPIASSSGQDADDAAEEEPMSARTLVKEITENAFKNVIAEASMREASMAGGGVDDEDDELDEPASASAPAAQAALAEQGASGGEQSGEEEEDDGGEGAAFIHDMMTDSISNVIAKQLRIESAEAARDAARDARFGPDAGGRDSPVGFKPAAGGSDQQAAGQEDGGAGERRGAAKVSDSGVVAAPSGAVNLSNFLVISGPSGVGKGTLIARLIQEHGDRFGFSVSHTTRGPRPGEVENVDYTYVTREYFKEAIDRGEFLEHCEVHGEHYGTSTWAAAKVCASGKVAILDIDVQGAMKVRDSSAGHLAKFLFVAPRSLEELEVRLRGRGTETEEKILRRLGNAAGEMEQANKPGFCDAIVVNGELEQAYTDLKSTLGKLLPGIFPEQAARPPSAARLSPGPPNGSKPTTPRKSPVLIAVAGSPAARAPPTPPRLLAAHPPAPARDSPVQPALPVQQYMDKTIVPILREGLRALNESRPDDPLLFLADYLLSARARISNNI